MGTGPQTALEGVGVAHWVPQKKSLPRSCIIGRDAVESRDICLVYCSVQSHTAVYRLVESTEVDQLVDLQQQATFIINSPIFIFYPHPLLLPWRIYAPCLTCTGRPWV